jgi:cellobiose phosphorylase
MQHRQLSNSSGLTIEWADHGAIRRIDAPGLRVNLFMASASEAGLANLWLRRVDASGLTLAPLLGPHSPLRRKEEVAGLSLCGHWGGLDVQVDLRLAEAAPAWFWHVQVVNTGPDAQTLQLVSVQDIGLAPWASIRLNEYYVSHYLDLAPLRHPRQGWVLAARQNQAVDGRHPWVLMASLRQAESYATDAFQVLGHSLREGRPPQGIVQGLPGARLQHEHALLALQDLPLRLEPGSAGRFGCCLRLLPDHELATQDIDAAWVDTTLALAEACPPQWDVVAAGPPGAAPPLRAHTLFSRAPLLATRDLEPEELEARFPAPRRQLESAAGVPLSFFHAARAHVVLRAKELAVQRPHGHILRSGRHLVPDETALTSTVWMGGVFHSMLTQGHVGINRFLSTVRGWLATSRSQGLRVFVHSGGQWQQLGLPSAFEIEPQTCRWLYRHEGGLIEVRSLALGPPHAMGLNIRVLDGAALALRVTFHIALGGDEGVGAVPWQRRGKSVFVGVPAGSDLAARFPGGGFSIEPAAGTDFSAVGGDELLWSDGRSRNEPFLVLGSAPVTSFGLRIVGDLVDAPAAAQDTVPLPSWTFPAARSGAAEAARLAEILPWYLQNALVHYLSPRGLEQFSGGGWGTRDVCQGPLEMLLALDRPAPVREILLRVFAAQNADGDWPQWFMFFERERRIRADDSHGDIVFWPLLGLARYLVASDDAALLDTALPFYTPDGAAADCGTVWQHVERALAVIRGRRIAGTALAAYGHGDWNDSLQPADPALRERLCSAWTVTLHHQTLSLLARALRSLGRDAAAEPLEAEARAVEADFQRHLVVDGVITGYARFEPGQPPQLLLHPADAVTGVSYSLLPMVHAILGDLLSPAQASAHRALIETHLGGPDGARLFDRPLAYRGGPQRLFQRAESSAFFGREIGAMYMHAHLRWAEALAHLGAAEALLDALALAHPLGLVERLPQASRRQANCYYSSSDAAFADRYQAAREYARIAAGTVALDGGWRIYSSGPGIALGLVVGCLLGLRREARALVLDPVMPAALEGLQASVALAGQRIELLYRPGPLGCGPSRIEHDGQPLAFERRHNPYRCGAAVLPLAPLLARLQGGSRQLVIHTG